MDKINHHNKINILKAFAIMLVVSGHLEFSLIPGFPPYSFQLALFFFISGILFNDKYGFWVYTKKRIKSLLFPYFAYALFYLVLTIALAPVVKKFWGLPITFKNEIIMPFLTGHQLDLISPLWFVPQLFISLIVFYVFNRLKLSNNLKTFILFILALIAIQLEPFSKNLYILLCQRTMFSLLFIYLGFLYKNSCDDFKTKLFSSKMFYIVMITQSILWFTNKDYTPQDGIGLSYILVWGNYDNWIVPVLTSLSGIWISLFILENVYDRIKNCSFLHKIGENTYHIMANHLLVFNILTYTFLYIKRIPFEIKNNADIYMFYYPLKTTYFYFVFGIITTTYLGIFLKRIKSYITSFLTSKLNKNTTKIFS